ncbi:MAG: cytochrome P450 [Actinomycetota bacterium]
MDPVTDWTSDFDIADPDYQNDPYPVWDELRAGCPVATSDRRMRTVLPVGWDDISAVAYDTEHFSSVDVGTLPPPSGSSTLVAPPITSDPPFHTAARRILLPHFSPAATERVRPHTEAICRRLVDEVVAVAAAGDGTVDAAEAYAQHIPVGVIAHLLGIPDDDIPVFLDWAIRIFQSGEPAVIRTATKEILAYFADQVAERRQEPAGDLISALLEADLDGSPLTDKHLTGTCFLLLMAGIDTTWSSIGAALWHLATNHDDRDRLVAEPELRPMAIEELLRAYAPVTMARIATDDTEVGGCPVHAGDKVLLPFPAGNRDPEKFEQPDEVVIDRARNRHFAFGIGIHRCLGSNLARMEMQVAIDTWLDRFPRFALAEGTEVRWGGTQVRGPRELPVVLG